MNPLSNSIETGSIYYPSIIMINFLCHRLVKNLLLANLRLVNCLLSFCITAIYFVYACY